MLNADKELQDAYDYLAPDGFEIRHTIGIRTGGLSLYARPAGYSGSNPPSVEEIWYVLSGGEFTAKGPCSGD